MRHSLLLILPFLAPALPAMAELQAFPPTRVGQPELKTLPAGVLLKSSGSGGYFAQANGLFMPLFRYIQRHEIAMTVPVEAQVDQAAMYFWVAESEAAKVAGNESGVVVERRAARPVASLGARGSYSEKNFITTRDRLLAWVREQPGLEAAGEPYAVYWSGPFTPGFLKRYEVHVPVRKKPAS
ncbi:MAG: heme-binding protein [Opitutaceae bacterium]|nr:heme-binding protein [Opitutaceae bacterium]